MPGKSVRIRAVWLSLALGCAAGSTLVGRAQAAEPGETAPAADTAAKDADKVKAEQPAHSSAASKTAAVTASATTDATTVPAAPSEGAPVAKLWDVKLFGHVRAGFEHVQRDPNVDFVGRNSGFVLQTARIGVAGKLLAVPLSFKISLEAASDQSTHVNSATSELQVRGRDVYMRYDFLPELGAQLGQFKAPWVAEELLDYEDLLFASRAVAQQGVLSGRGYQEQGIALDRQLGLMLSPAKPIALGPVGLSYFAMVMNGNGANQLLNDNNSFGLVGRLEARYQKYVVLGGGVYDNKRTVGTLPTLYDESDRGYAGDLQVRVAGVEVMGQVAQVTTKYPTVGAHDRSQLGYHVQAGYIVDVAAGVLVEPGYRYAHLDPWAGSRLSPTGEDYRAYKLDYHTVGVKVFHKTVPLIGYLNYTITQEPEARRLSNNRLEIIGHLSF
jgi:hypothetical protein